MSNKPSASLPQEGALQRGKACLSCRRRKMRCDGARPFCTQCVRGNRAEDCEYTDNQGRTRTQVLEENIALLQARIEALESPDQGSQSVFLHDPYANDREASASMSISMSPGGEARTSQVIPNPIRPGSVPAVMSWWEVEEPPAQITETLIDTFLPHALSLGFGLSTVRFRAALSLPTLHPARPHPALLHAVFLWALRLSKTPDLQQHENLYLQRAILALQDALGVGADLDGSALAQRRVHAMQAEVLLAQYFFSLGRLLEGRYHANAAVSLAVSCGLHRISPVAPASSTLAGIGAFSMSSASLFELAPARDATELGERIRVFWAVYDADRCWSVALGAPCVLVDDAALGMQIDTPWPRDMGDNDQVNITTLESRGRTVQCFLSGQTTEPQTGAESSLTAFRAKAASLYERAARLSSMWYSAASQVQSQASILTDLQTLARTTTQFARGLVPLDQLSIHDGMLCVVHGLAHAAMIQLNSVRASTAQVGDLSATNAALMHASEVLKILEKLTAGSPDVGPLDPITSVVGLAAAQVFVQEYNRMRRLPLTQAANSRIEALNANIDRITAALRRGADASNNCPIFAQQVSKIEEMLRGQS